MESSKRPSTRGSHHRNIQTSIQLAVSHTIDWSGCFVLVERNITFSFGVFMYYVADDFIDSLNLKSNQNRRIPLFTTNQNI